MGEMERGEGNDDKEKKERKKKKEEKFGNKSMIDKLKLRQNENEKNSIQFLNLNFFLVEERNQFPLCSVSTLDAPFQFLVLRFYIVVLISPLQVVSLPHYKSIWTFRQWLFLGPCPSLV
jgi:hypothetical protein